MRILIGIVIIMWIIVMLLTILFSKKYSLVKAMCINETQCKLSKKVDGLVYFEYENDFGNGLRKNYGQASTVSRIQEGKEYKILVVKVFDERVIVFDDVKKLFICLCIISVLILLLPFTGLSYFSY